MTPRADELDRELLAKLLARTGSDHDGEALAAIRKANELLKRQQLSWDGVVAERPPPAASAFGPEAHDVPAGFRFYGRPPAPPPPRTGFAGLAATLAAVLAFPATAARAYWREFRRAALPRSRVMIACAAPVAVAVAALFCWAPPLLSVAYLVEAFQPAPHPPEPLSPEMGQRIVKHLAACWHQPEESKRLDERVTVVLAMNPDGTVRRAGLTRDPGSDPVLRAFADSAVRSVHDPRCQPLPLPRDEYEAWKTLAITFVSRPPGAPTGAPPGPH